MLDRATRGRSTADAERALLDLKVVDPACGSGHFLIAAAHRIAKRLAAVRTGEGEPSPEATRRALRDVVGRVLHGVDANPMAVELCKVALWMDAVDPGRPLSFLDGRIVCGNSLLGATPALLARGVPDEAWTALTGDDAKAARELKKQNREERGGQQTLFAAFDEAARKSAAEGRAAALAADALPEGSLVEVRAKEEAWRRAQEEPARQQALLAADAWCAAFAWPKRAGAPEAPTDAVYRRIAAGGRDAAPATTVAEVERLAARYRFLHWHLAFPTVFEPLPPAEAAKDESGPGWRGGFDVVLGNPPWERIKLEEKQWFAGRDDEIATAPNKAARERLIEARETSVRETDRALIAAFREDTRAAEAESHFVRASGRYPLCGRGDVNTYAVFAETKRALLDEGGRVGMIVPSGIATDDTTKHFFQALVESGGLASLFDFQSGPGLFAEIGHARFKFALVTMQRALTAMAVSAPPDVELAFFLRDPTLLADPDTRFRLTAADIALINPNTRTCPIFRTRRDADITKAIYRRVPVLVAEGPPERNPWGVTFTTLFHMSNASHLFRTRAQLEAPAAEGEDAGAAAHEPREPLRLAGNRFVHATGRETWLPLYEAKMVHQFDHRFGDYQDRPEDSESTQLPDVPLARLQDPFYAPLPRYWVPAAEVEDRLRDRWDRGWLLGWRDICRSTDERTVIASVVPRVGVNHKFQIALPEQSPGLVACLAATLGSFALDYVARQKVGGTSLPFFTMRQLAVLPPDRFLAPCPWPPFTSSAASAAPAPTASIPTPDSTPTSTSAAASPTLADWIRPRVLELVYTAWDLEPFAKDVGYDGPPFRWDDERRFLLRCELDAAFFHLYGLARDDAAYVMDTFPIVQRRDVAQHGRFRTKDEILSIYDALALAEETRRPYATRLDPPPADPRVAHPPRSSAVAPAASARAAASARPAAPGTPALPEVVPPPTAPVASPQAPLRLLHDPAPAERYLAAVPLYAARVAASAFAEGHVIDGDRATTSGDRDRSPEPLAWVALPPPLSPRVPDPRLFALEVTGASMEPRVPSGSLCLFRRDVAGSRDGKLLLVEHASIHDRDFGGSYTLKRYESTKTHAPDGSWSHTSIRLLPENPAFSPIDLAPADASSLRVLAELVAVLGPSRAGRET